LREDKETAQSCLDETALEVARLREEAADRDRQNDADQQAHSSHVDQLNTEITRLHSVIEECNHLVSQKDAELAELAASLNQQREKDQADAESFNTKLDALHTAALQAQGVVDGLQNDIVAAVDSANNYKRRNEDLDAQLSQLQKRIEFLEQDKALSESSSEEVSNRLHTLLDEKNSLEADLRDERQRVESVSSELTALRMQNSELGRSSTNQQAEISSLNGICNDLKAELAELSEQNRVLAGRSEELSDANRELTLSSETAEKALALKHAELEELSQRYDAEVAAVKSQLEAVVGKTTDLEEQFHLLQTAKAQVDDDLTKSVALVKSLQEDNDAWIEEVETLENDKVQLSRQIEQLQAQQTEAATAAAAFSQREGALEEKLTVLGAEKQELEKQLRESNERMELLLKDKAQLGADLTKNIELINSLQVENAAKMKEVESLQRDKLGLSQQVEQLQLKQAEAARANEVVSSQREVALEQQLVSLVGEKQALEKKHLDAQQEISSLQTKLEISVSSGDHCAC
jgi:chromosome segregation ATPase